MPKYLMVALVDAERVGSDRYSVETDDGVSIFSKAAFEKYCLPLTDAIGTKLGLKTIEDRLWSHLGFALQWAKNGLTTATAEANEHLESKPPTEDVED